jgi:hypothetical protein
MMVGGGSLVIPRGRAVLCLCDIVVSLAVTCLKHIPSQRAISV